MPVKPKVIICVIDYPAGQGICNETSGESITSAAQLEYATIVSEIIESGARVPLSAMDKSICFAPTEWEKVRDYIDDLERFAKGHQ